MKLHDVPSAALVPAYRTPPQSGDDINGLNLREPVRPKRVFHTPGRPNFAWAAMNNFFLMNSSLGVLLRQMRVRWLLRRSAGPVAKPRVEVADPAAMAAQIKAKAKAFGAGTVGIAEFSDADLYDDVDFPYRYGICIAIPMQREDLVEVPHSRAGIGVQNGYYAVAKTAIRLAEYIRSLGWPALAYCDPRSTDILQIPLAVRAGLGQLGKHGSMICTEYGSNFRLSSVATNLPLALDAPVDIGVDDLCMNCRRCTTDCPPAAIFEDKQWVRGVERWYVSFDKCVPYFSITEGCAICIEVCPWSEPGRGPKLSRTLLAKRRKAAAPTG